MICFVEGHVGKCISMVKRLRGAITLLPDTIMRGVEIDSIKTTTSEFLGRSAKEGVTMMDQNKSGLGKIPLLCLGLTLAFLSILTVRACTIFVLTDSKRALFCNNE